MYNTSLLQWNILETLCYFLLHHLVTLVPIDIGMGHFFILFFSIVKKSPIGSINFPIKLEVG